MILKHIKLFESFEEGITVEIEKEYLIDSYHKLLSLSSEDSMDFMEFEEMFFDTILNELRVELKNTTSVLPNFNIKEIIQKSHGEYYSVSFYNIINYEKAISIIKNIFGDSENYTNVYLPSVLINGETYHLSDNISNHTNSDIDYSSFSKDELRIMTDDAIESGDYELLDKLRKFI